MKWLAIVSLFVCILASSHVVSVASEIDFNRDVRPIFSDKCFACHGPDKKQRKSDLRFDREDGIHADLGGYVAVSPGRPEESEIHHRIWSDDPDEQMPPPDSKLSLSTEERRILDQWIELGAPWATHWSFEPIEKPELPDVSATNRDWVRNPIDYFIAQRLEVKGLKPSPATTRESWIRRVYLDLLGLPPTPEEVETFLADPSETAWESVVDHVLASPHFGERMALPWLDAARYADTGGYQGDVRKTQWPWRDWVIRAYNRNIPFDQFTIEQLAGDLLPDPTDEQLLATAFNRNHRINDEGGIIPEEFLVEYVADRVETTSTVWMGLTTGCARCHDHKYDPISQRNFYELFAFFHNVPEKGKDGDLAPEPNLKVYTGGTKEEHEALQEKAEELRERQEGYAKAHRSDFLQWVKEEAGMVRSNPEWVQLSAPILYLPLDREERKRFINLGVVEGTALSAGTAKRLQSGQEAKYDKGVRLLQGGFLNAGRETAGREPSGKASWLAWVKPTGDVAGAEGPVFSCVAPDAAARGYQVSLIEAGDGSFHLGFRLIGNRAKDEMIEVRSLSTIPRNEFSQIGVTWDGSLKADGADLFVNGDRVAVEVLSDTFRDPAPYMEDLLIGAETESSADRSIRDQLLANTLLDDLRVYDEALSPKQMKALNRLDPVALLAAAASRNKSEESFLSDAYFRDHNEDYKKLLADATRSASELKSFEAANITDVSVMREMEKPRDTYLLQRGAYDQPDTSRKLSPAVPGFLPPMPEGLPRNRLGLAKWLLRPEHPLTARVAVNRYWQMIFGRGLVETPEDFGSQGSPPTHPELLDWLAADFRDKGWDTKEFLKQVVLSATYRQSSMVSRELLEKDPANRWLARAPRFRLSGAVLRDQALAVSGLMDRTVGGKPVMPYQPVGLWEEVSAKGTKYVVAEGSDLYRRSIYTFWRRTVPPPSMMNFDSSSRETCTVTVSRTNTPLQALNLLNDPQYFEAARYIAERMMREGGNTAEERISWSHRLVLSRSPDEAVTRIFVDGFRRNLREFRADPAAAESVLGVGKTNADDSLDEAELAAFTTVASILLNLDETVTKE